MKPDFVDWMPEIATVGRRSVPVVPVQFLADHLEILYDFRRMESLKVEPAR